jgi:TRAP-type C4-dicarboxylate transport system permease small subunit
MNGLPRLLEQIRRLEVGITTCAFLVLILVIFADVIVRRVTGSGIVWAREVGVFANIVLCIVGIGIASANGGHLRPRFVDRWVPRSWDSAMVRVQELLTAAAFGVLTWLALGVVSETRELAEQSTILRWPVWMFQLSLPLAFGLAALRHGLFGLYPALRPVERGEGDLDIPEQAAQGSGTAR